jgi:CelD/BcsL family acetyltransferase involved in cellulose biosynthesis
LNKPFNRYFKENLKSKFRRTIKMNNNRLARAGSSRLVYYRGEDAIKLWPELLRLEDSGWKGRGGTSMRRIGENFQRYYDGLVSVLAQRQNVNLYFLELNGSAIAGGLGYAEADTFHWAKAGYDEQFMRLSPSNLLLVQVIEHLITHFPTIRRVHLFPWDYGYKHRFTNEKATCIDTVLYSDTLRGKGAWYFFKLKQSLKPLLKKKIE